MLKQGPLMKAVQNYINSDWTRFHMPGHKGVAAPLDKSASYAYDMTEVEGLDSLFEECDVDPKHPIKALEAQFTQLYESKRSVLSTQGSTLCIQTMLKLVGCPGGKIIAGRNIHVSAVNAMALLGLEAIWVYPEQSKEGLAGQISPKEIRLELENSITKNAQSKVCAVYITSPDYFGILSDISQIAEICDKYNVPLLVDNAHGAHLKFLSGKLHPIDQGADLCCDSLHKTLPALTGAALLHCGNAQYVPNMKGAMSVFASTSPSYITMISCDSAASFLQNAGRKELQRAVRLCEEFQGLAQKIGFNIPKYCEPMRLTLPLYSTGYDAQNLRPILRKHKIMEEFLNDSACVMLLSPFNSTKDLQRLRNFLTELHPAQNAVSKPKLLLRPQSVMGLREALLSPKETVKINEAVGKIAAQVKSPCPPGIPLVMPGEVLHSDEVEMLKLYGIFSIDVLK